jgi:raffinose/stachyose/melibiose transport system permease protein
LAIVISGPAFLTRPGHPRLGQQGRRLGFRAVLLAVIGSLTTYNLIYILTDGQFGTNTLGIFAFNSAFASTADLGLGAAVTTMLLAAAVLVALPVLAFLRYREVRLFR